ncbi:MAG: hypothetical protein JW841_05905 [Deltaproteobacteria bacterium]|nr:hypothetical protein [Deltaproteobacteria bacterium]
MTRVVGGGQPPVINEETNRTPSTPQQSSESQAKATGKSNETAKTDSPNKTSVDSFVRATTLFEKQLQSLSGKALARQIQFTSVQLAEIAAAFAVIMKRYPRASRKERARRFAKTILKHKRIGKLFEEAEEEELEKMFDAIAEQLDGSPMFAQLIEDVSEGASKMMLG